MYASDIDDVWAMLDRERLAGIAREGPQPVFAAISGAHLYGFASPDSDVDLRGAYLLPVEDVIGLRVPRETIEISDNRGLDLDWVAHDLRKFARMLIQHNGYVLEQLFSPLVVIATPAYEELQALGAGCVTRPTVRHYQGFARGRRKRLAEPGATVKHLLYAYRVFLTGIHMMGTGTVESNLRVLNDQFRFAAIDELIARKRGGAEKMALDPAEMPPHDKLLDQLEKTLVEAHAASQLPEEATTFGALDDLVVRLRLAARR